MRITKDPEVRKMEIIETALNLFKTKGIEKTTISEIAKSIGVAKGLIYYYFTSKEKLVDAVIEEFIRGVDKELEKIMMDKSLNFYSKLTSILDLYFNSIQSHLVVLSYTPKNPGILALIRERLSTNALFYAKDLIDQGIEEKVLKIEYPEYMLEIIIKGLGDLFIRGITDPKIHSILVAQLLGLEENKLIL